MLLLNRRSQAIADLIACSAAELKVQVQQLESGTRVLDCGNKTPGGLQAGLLLAEVCLAGLGKVSLSGETDSQGDARPYISVQTDHPVEACLRAQYAGWQIADKKFFAMGSGPMRAAAAREELFAEIGGKEQTDVAVGILETSQTPTDSIACQIAEQCGVAPDKLTLLVARTASLAGTIQVVARSVETAMHKLHALGFPLHAVVSGWGTAPLPPVGSDDLQSIGWTNDAVLYGGHVTLWVRGASSDIERLGSQVPSSSSSSWGESFRTLFDQAGGDFYKLDPSLFSPARVTFIDLENGRQHSFGTIRTDVLNRSFGAAS